jgi:hypothetical protein
MNQANWSGNGDYVIRVKGHLDEGKTYWFEGLTMATGFDEDGRPITTFSGPLADQAALHGVLAKIRDMNLPLISVNQVELDTKDSP